MRFTTAFGPARQSTGATPLINFRAAMYRSLTSWGDALFELSDSILCAPGPVTSVPTLSLEPVFRRSHGSLYKGLELGEIDALALRDALWNHRPREWPLVFAVDSSTWARCDAETSPERGFHYSASHHSAGQPIVAGWSYQWISQLGWEHNSWTAPVDAIRVAPSVDSVTATAAQIRNVARRVSTNDPVPLFVFDAGYDPMALTAELAEARANVLVRIRDDRVFYSDPQPRRPRFAEGRPRRHGNRFDCDDSTTWPSPDSQLIAEDSRYGTVDVRAWNGLHPKLGTRGHWVGRAQPPIVRGTVIRVQVEHLPKPAGRALKTLWLWASTPIDLDTAWRAYLRRFDIEHTFRFVKGTLGWTTPSLRTPEQADRWTWLVVAAYTQLRLARQLVADQRMPWERPRELHQLTPHRVRRGFRWLGATIGTPASPPKPNRAGPGRPKGTLRPPRTRYPAIKKAA